MKKQIIKLIGLTLLSALFVGCMGQIVPPATTVLMVKPSGASEIYTEGAFKAWGRDRAYFVDTKLKSYPKEIRVLCADGYNIDISLKWVGSFDVTEATIETIKNKVPSQRITSGDIKGSELSLDKFFKTAMEDVLSNVARGIIAPNNIEAIRSDRITITEAIKNGFVAKIKELKYPVLTADVLLTNIGPPEEYLTAMKRIKDAELKDQENAALAKAAVAKAQRDAELAAEVGKAALVTAEADAAANRARTESLSPEILMVKQLELLEQIALGPNNSVVLVPYTSLGSQLQSNLLDRENLQQILGVKKLTSTDK